MTSVELDGVESTLAPLTIVGVGASAGGLAATATLLRHLGPKPRLAIVVVQHLDPHHDSSLAEILSRDTSLPVQVAAEGTRAQIDHVYVVPPNVALTIEAGLLRLTPRGVTAGLHLPIDRFFASLAANSGSHAIGVILSGNGADGSRGIEAIKNEGGLAFAQDASAEYRSMPDSAFATGRVDFQLPPAAIAQELLRVRDLSDATPLTAAVDDEPMLRRIFDALRKATGVDFANYKRSTIRRRIARRIFVLRLGSLLEYASLLERDASEAKTLSEGALIHVTGFFRDPDMFAALTRDVFPKLLENRPSDAALRVWITACSTGEEVYSIAISLLEFLADAHAEQLPIKLFGTDVSERAIARARAGSYPEGIEHEVSGGRLQRFFHKVAGAYQIRKEVRDLCVFARHDVTRDPPFSAMDLITCRNLMIYLGPALQDRVLPVFHYALKTRGFLVLGSAESTRSYVGFTTLDATHKIFVRSSAAPPPTFDFDSPHVAASQVALSTGAARAREIQREADRAIAAEWTPPGVIVTEELAIVQFRGKTAPYLEPAPGPPSFDLLRRAREELRVPLRQLLAEARATHTVARKTGIRLTNGQLVDCEALPFTVPETQQRHLVVLFRDATATTDALSSEIADRPPAGAISAAEAELASTRDYLQSVIEQLEATNEALKAANEESVSSNEELRSTNEELQVAKEELQATNEELTTVNDEMEVRNADGARLNDDLMNVINSVAIPIVLLGRDSRIRRFTPAAARLFNLIATDVGRPMQQIRPNIVAPELDEMIAQVLVRLAPSARSVRDQTGHWYELTVRPYLTLDNRIDGTVISAFDIDAVKKSAQLASQAREYASIVDTISQSLLVLTFDLRVHYANQAFRELFAVVPVDIEGQLFHQLGGGEWDVPALRQQLARLPETDQRFERFRISKHFQKPGFRAFELSARVMRDAPLILLAIDDVTERERASKAVERTEIQFRDMLTNAAGAILMTDAEGRIIFENRVAAQLFGFELDELLGVSIERLLPAGLPALGVDAPTANARSIAIELRSVGRRKDQSEFPIEVVQSTMLQETGAVTVSFIADMTKRHAADEQIRRYQEQLQSMAFDAAVAEEHERRRIATGLHDEIGQSLALAQIKLSTLRSEAGLTSSGVVEETIALLRQAIAKIRALTFDLSPPILYDLGLKAALSWLVEDLEQRTGMHIELRDDDTPKPLDDATAALAFRAVRELLMNVFKHAKAASCRVSLRGAGGFIEIDVEDQGTGFDPEGLASRPNAGFGLFSVREQVGRLGGAIAIVSAPERGTRIHVRVPLQHTEPELDREQVVS